MTKAWTYGEEGLAYPVRTGEVWRSGNHLFVCSDLMADTLLSDVISDQPSRPSLLYTDPPWGQALLNGFRTKANLAHADYSWTELYRKIASIGHDLGVPVWVECSKIENKDGAKVPGLLRDPRAPHIAYVEMVYFKKSPMGLYAASPDPIPQELLDLLRGVDDTDSPAMVMSAYPPSGVVLDPCAGRGQTSRSAESVGWASINNELNPNRVSAALARLGGEPERLA